MSKTITTTSTRRPAYITPREAAEQIGIVAVVKDPERTIRTWARRGELVARMIGRVVMISQASVDAYIGEDHP